jgi:hypothetical protein
MNSLLIKRIFTCKVSHKAMLYKLKKSLTKASPELDVEKAQLLNAYGCYRLLHGAGRQAARDFKRVDRLVRAPREASARCMLARAYVYYKLEEYGRVIHLLETALELAQSSPELSANCLQLSGITKIESAESYLLVAEGIELLKKAKSLGKDVTWDLAKGYLKLGEMTGEGIEYSMSIDLFRQAKKEGVYCVSFLADFYRAYMRLGSIVRSEQNFKGALTCLKSIGQLDKSASLDTPLARTYTKLYDCSGKNQWKYAVSEIGVGLGTGLIFGVACGLILYGLSTIGLGSNAVGPFTVGVIVSGGLASACTAATLLGVFAPLAFARVGIDPAIASGPIITALNDFLAMVIYFTIASILTLVLT